jgi:hypothetical protein
VIPATEVVEIGRIIVQSQPRQNIIKTSISTNKPGMVVYTCHPIYMGDIGSWWSETCNHVAGKHTRPYLKKGLVEWLKW